MVDSLVAAAAIGPTGRVHIVRADSSVAVIENRAERRWGSVLAGTPLQIWGAGAGRLVVTVPGDNGPSLSVLSAGKAPIVRRLPQGPVAVSRWGDFGVVGTDSGLVMFDPADSSSTQFLALPHRARAVAVSPAGHRIYVADVEGALLGVDRFELHVIEHVQLPGTGVALRLDPLGRTALVRAARGDSLWVVDVTTFRFVATVRAEWSGDLPAVAPNGGLLVARDGDVIALAPDSLVETGRIPGGARDRWLVAEWDPKRPALQLAADTAPRTPDPGELHFVQVSSTANEAWAEDLARNLRAAGMQASVLSPSLEEDRYRVVLGPFPTREAAEGIGRKLGRPYWIFTRARQPATPS